MQGRKDAFMIWCISHVVRYILYILTHTHTQTRAEAETDSHIET